ncbi:hypothetical protein CCMSSC00406_0001686 [Pleurotus cornucopiae]|uniref:Uncharacterized protein n=1 Tax=Pleurotus cornucopiae TaxID=5321 RepID=A0ACB7IQE3_PLECO|nr:hypothetical protein CCMSSC00406_0001686 [Pleurotus cornucopiae]
MFSTPMRRAAAPNLSKALQHLLPKELPPSLSAKPGNLYEVLSRTPAGGVGRKVHQLRWSDKQIPDSFWLVTRSQFKCEGKHGKAWGRLYWKGKLVSEKEEKISGALKYRWATGPTQPTRRTAA